jgi:hypothetical protein
MKALGLDERWTIRNRVGTLVRHAGLWFDMMTYKPGGGRAIPHLAKRRIVLDYANRHGCGIFVETGTYLGDMVSAAARMFAQVHSVELSEYYYRRACRRFAGIPNVSLHFGNSADVLPRVIENLSGPTLFWLDAHYSGGITARAGSDTPIVEELAAILGTPASGHVVLIDDARCFDGSAGYPTLREIESLIAAAAPGYVCEVATDIIRVTSKGRK